MYCGSTLRGSYETAALGRPPESAELRGIAPPREEQRPAAGSAHDCRAAPRPPGRSQRSSFPAPALLGLRHPPGHATRTETPPLRGALRIPRISLGAAQRSAPLIHPERGAGAPTARGCSARPRGRVGRRGHPAAPVQPSLHLPCRWPGQQLRARWPRPAVPPLPVTHRLCIKPPPPPAHIPLLRSAAGVELRLAYQR